MPATGTISRGIEALLDRIDEEDVFISVRVGNAGNAQRSVTPE
jgi:hypothetical protein